MIKYSQYSSTVSLTTPIEVSSGNVLKMFADGITAGYISGTNLSGFNDLSGQDNHGTKEGTGSPQLIANGFGSHKVVRLGGANTACFNFTEITNARSFVWIGKENAAKAGGILMGSDATYSHCARGLNQTIFYYSTDTASYKWTRQKVRINGKLISAHGKTIPTSAVSIITGVASSNFRLNNLAMDTAAAYIFGGDVALFKIYDKELNDVEMAAEIAFWSWQLGITTNYTGQLHQIHSDGDSIGVFVFPYFENGNADASISNIALSTEPTDTSAGGSKIADIITRSDNNTIPNVAKSDICILIGINDVDAYYLNDVAVQRSTFRASLESLYSKLKAKQAFLKMFIATVGEIYVAGLAEGNQAIIDAIPYHYIYNEEIANLAVAHSDVHVVDIRTVLDGTTAANYADGLHPSDAGKIAMANLFMAAMNTQYA